MLPEVLLWLMGVLERFNILAYVFLLRLGFSWDGCILYQVGPGFCNPAHVELSSAFILKVGQFILYRPLDSLIEIVTSHN